MFNKFLRNNKDQLIISYKILHDILFVALVFFFIFLLAEVILPGIVTNHLSFTKTIFFVFTNIFLIYILGNYLKISLGFEKENKKTATILLVVLALLTINSLLKINFFFVLIITISVLAAGYYIYKTVLEEN